MAPGADRAAADDAGVASTAAQFWNDGADHHLLHLIGHARNGEDDLFTHGTHKSRSGAGLLRDASCADRDKGLTQVVARHAASARSEHLEQEFDDFLVLFQRNAHNLGDDISRDVILGRPESATHDDSIAAVERNTQCHGDAVPVVTNLRLQEAVDAGECELLADP
ncbi:unannotated protein [freshwater metagenome]|uniref:Unannotated protein n=1 Tax=freshwater metagenome TaxID=449393 RepID=A0A6J5YG47_9ZZZZ